MNTFAKLTAFTLATSAVYTGIANLLPQIEAHPPALLEVGPWSRLTPEDLSSAGEDVFLSECGFCHGAAARCPDLGDVGAVAAARARERAAASGQPYTPADYLVEALCRPGDHLVEGYDDLMPPQGGALSPGQVLAVVAWMQDQGGTATVTGRDVAPLERFGCVGAAEPARVAVGSPEEVFGAFGCAGCHPADGGIGPSLADVGARLGEPELFEAILDPDAKVAPPWPAGVMRQTLESNGFYARMTAADYRALVGWLAAPADPEATPADPEAQPADPEARPAAPGEAAP